MNFSDKIKSLQPSPTVALNAKAKELKANGLDVLNFTVGEPDFSTAKEIRDVAITALKKGKTKYGPAGGGLEIREAISKKLQQENNLQFEISQIVCGIGAKEILFHTFLSILNEGDEVLIPAPYWVSYKDQILACGAKPVIVPFELGDSAPSYLDTKKFEEYATDRTKAIILCSPNNPVGYAFNEEELKVLGNYLKTKDHWWIISDEIYEYLSFEHEHLSLLQLFPDFAPRFALINGLSKGFAMTGWRVGYLAGPLDLVAQVKKLQSHSSTCLPPFIEEAAAFALGLGKSFMQPQIDLLKKRKDFVLDCVKNLKALNYIEPKGAFYLFLDFRSLLQASDRFDEHDTMSLCKVLLEEYLIALVPGEAFGAPGFARMSYAVSEEIIEEGFRRLGNAVSSL